MRLPLIAPADLSPEQKPLYDDMRKGIAGHFNAFKVEREDGALMGPWNPWLHEPSIGKAIWDFTLAMTANAVLPDNVRQIAILLQPFVPDSAEKLLDLVGVPADKRNFAALGAAGRLVPGTPLEAPNPVFPRYVAPEA